MLIENATILTIDPTDTIHAPGWLRIEEGRIEAVSARPLVPRPGEPRIDATDLVVMPGIVNSHTHLFQTLLRGVYEGLPFVDWLRRIYHCGLALGEDDFRLAARLGAVEALRSGTTTIVEHHFLNGAADGPSATLEGLASMGVRAVLARTSMDIGELAPADLLETPARAVAAAERLIGERRRNDGRDGMVTLMVGPNTPGISAGPEMAIAMSDLAESLGVGQSMHVAESRSVLEAVRSRYGVDGVIRWLDGIGALRGRILAAHSVHVDEGERAIMAERRVSMAHNPVSNLYLGDGFAPVAEARDAGVTVGLGTDGAASNNSQDMFEVLKLAALLQRARLEDGQILPAREALRLATVDGARAIGLDQLIGSVEPGKRADLVVLDLLHRASTVTLHDVTSQIVHCASAANVWMVIVDGEVRLADGQLVNEDEAGLLAEAQAAGRALASRLA